MICKPTLLISSFLFVGTLWAPSTFTFAYQVNKNNNPKRNIKRDHRQQVVVPPKKNNKHSNNNNNSNHQYSSNIEIPQSVTDERNQTPLNCPHFDSCPGCITSKNYSDIPTIQSAKLFFAKQSTTTMQKNNNSPNPHHNNEEFYKTVIPSNTQHHRTQAKLVVRSKSSWGRNGCIFGLYERNSHNIIEIPNCVIHHPSINEAVNVLSQATAQVGTVGYNEDNHDQKGLRYVQLQVERKTNKVCMTLIWNGDNLKSCQPDLSRLIKACKKINPQLFHSIWCHTNASYGNSIFIRGERNWHPMDGPEFVREVLPGTSESEVRDRKGGLLHFTPMAFRQGNMDGFDAIAKHVAKEIPGGSKVCELYAGIGVLGLTALSYHSKKSKGLLDDDDNFDEWYENENYHGDDQNNESSKELIWLRCSDENPANPRCFQRTVNSMPSEVTGRISSKHNNKGKSFKKGSNKNKSNARGGGEKTLEDIMQDILNDDASSSLSSINPRKGKVSYMVASAAKALHEGQALGADVIIVDPPRKGLEDEVLTQLCKPHNPNQEYTEDPMFLSGPRHSINWTNDAHTLIYVSCGFDALASNCDKLLKGNAGWRLDSATGYVLFPGSNHVETVAVFKRRAGQQDYY